MKLLLNYRSYALAKLNEAIKIKRESLEVFKSDRSLDCYIAYYGICCNVEDVRIKAAAILADYGYCN